MERTITKGIFPCWIKFCFEPNPAAVRILVHGDQAKKLSTLTPASAPVAALAHYGKFSGWINWGFDGALRRLPQNAEGFVSYRFEFPEVKLRTGKRCPHCNGTSVDTRSRIHCLRCESGLATCDHEPAERITASVALLTTAVGRLPPERDTTAAANQLLSFESSARPFDFGLTADLSGRLMSWLRMLGVAPLEEVTSAMILAWNKMMRTNATAIPGIFANIAHENGWMNIGAPGNNCCLHPEIGSIGDAGGCRVMSHHVEQAHQQLAMIAALAKLDMLVHLET